MYTFVNSIIKLINEYKNINNFYFQECSNDISIFDFYNSLILFIYLFIIFLKFLIQRYGVKKILIFITTRFFVAMLLFLFIYVLSDFTICQTPINKSIGQYITNDKVKYICIATMTITGCCLVYKYLPLWYADVKSHTTYVNYLEKKNLYDLNLKIYLESKKAKMQYKQNCLDNFNLMYKNFTDSILNFLNLSLKFKDIINLFEKDKNIRFLNSSFSNFVMPRKQETFNYRLHIISTNYNKSLKIINELKTTDKVYNFNYALLEENHLVFLEEITTLREFYEKNINDSVLEIQNYLNTNLDNKNYLLEFNLRNKHLKTFNELDTLVDNTLNCSLFLLTFVETILESPIVLNNFDNFINFTTVPKPKKIHNIDYPLDNLDGLKFIGINFGYIFFYPIFYCSNKILGTSNPLSFIAFKKAISFFTFGGFF